MAKLVHNPTRTRQRADSSGGENLIMSIAAFLENRTLRHSTFFPHSLNQKNLDIIDEKRVLTQMTETFATLTE